MEYICSHYGSCVGKCKLTTQEQIATNKIVCPQDIVAAKPQKWVILTKEMKEAIED